MPSNCAARSLVAIVAVCTAASGVLAAPPDSARTPDTVPTFSTAAPEAVSNDTLDARLAHALHVGTVTAVPLLIDNRPGQPLNVSVPIEGAVYQLDLVPHSVRSPRYQVIVNRPDGSMVQVAPATDCTLRGQITGLPGTVVAGGILEEGFYATIIMPDGSRWWLQPAESLLPDDPTVKTSDLAPGPQVRMHALFRGTDPTETAKCLNTEAVSDTTTSSHGFTTRGTSRRVAELAMDAEYAFYLKTGSVSRTQGILTTVINITNIQYEREVDIRHQVGTIIVRQTQVYSIGEAGNSLLNQVRNKWNAEETSIHRDIVMLIDGNGNGGQSFMGTICNTSSAYSGVGMDWLNICYRCDTAAHELGHSWSACHCPCATPGYTMNWVITNANRFFNAPGSDCGPTSISQIATFRDTRPCLTTETVGLGPPNDNCANAVTLPCTQDDIWDGCSFGFNNVWANTDGPVPPFGTDCTDVMTQDVWFRWVPGCNASVSIDTCVDTNFDTIIAAYDGSGGCPTSNDTMVACNDDNTVGCSNIRASSIRFQAVAGTPYYIRIGGYLNSQGGGIMQFRYTWSCPRPSNDYCSQPIAILQGTPTAFSTRGALTGQWVQPGGPPRDSWLEPACAGADDAQITNDIWYSFVAPCTGNARFSLCGSNFDTKLALYAACPTDNDTALTCNDDSGPACVGLQSSFDYPLLAGFNYLIRVGGYHGQVGEGTLQVDSLFCGPPANNNCANAQALASSSGTTFNAAAQQAGVDGASTCSFGGADIWYSFAAPSAGTFNISTCGTHDATGQDTAISFHTGCPGDTTNQISGACNDTSGTCGSLDVTPQRDASLSRVMTAGEQIYIRVAMTAGGRFSAPVTINYSFIVPAPGNDTCAGATSWTGTHTFSTLGATPDGGDSCAGGSGPDVWYRYTAPLAGTAGITICNPTYSPRLVVYGTGNCPASGAPLLCRTNPSCTTAATFVTSPGSSYLICLSGNSQQTGTGQMTIALAPATTGACCRRSGCTQTTQANCASLIGFYQGNGTVCTVPVNACCHADINIDNALTVQDIFDFLSAYFGNAPAGDFNGDGRPTVQDIFDFLAAYFAGC